MNDLTTTDHQMLEAITATELRRSKARGEKEPCTCCNNHRSIAVLHHVVPLADCAEWMNRGLLDSVSIPLIWLCPNCHQYLHKIFRAMNERGADKAIAAMRASTPEKQWDFACEMWIKRTEFLRAYICGGEEE